ncbi:hypothetical protein [Nonomuraea sp. NPDC048826]|uniref:hypothetical protein n=1 Tax=Nonomuraea sp. NPDC048826 TaxID=3364347 RepID=UPI003712332F
MNTNTNINTTARYMYIMTVAEGFNGRAATITGSVDVASGASRLSICTEIIEVFKHRHGFESLIVLFFNIEPDVL